MMGKDFLSKNGRISHIIKESFLREESDIEILGLEKGSDKSAFPCLAGTEQKEASHF